MTTIPPEALQFAGSLVAILVLALIARWLGLGGAPALADDAAVREACEHAVPGFEPVALARDLSGSAALARDASGRVLVLRGHGSHFAGRLLSPSARVTGTANRLDIDSGERRFGTISLEVEDPSAWRQAIAAINGNHRA